MRTTGDASRTSAAASGPRILFVSPCGPYPKVPPERDPLDFFYYRNTLGQGPFRLRSFQSWYSLHFLAQNLPVPSVVLENPTLKRFQREVDGGRYSAVAMGFTVITTGRILAMAEWLKAAHPDIDVILGGYGTAVFRDPDETARRLRALADHVCDGEGVAFMQEYLARRWGIRHTMPLRQDFIPMRHCFYRTSLPYFSQLVVVGALGCTYGCSFCATSSQFGRRRIPIASGRTLFTLLLQQARAHPRAQSAIIYDEDFLMNRERALEFMHCMEWSEELHARPMLLTVFASVRSVRQYTTAELVRGGIGTIYIGVESFDEEVLGRESLGKRQGDVAALFEELHRHGICTLGSLIVGWDGQSRDRMLRESARFVALNPTFYQVVPLHPAPGTALWDRLKREGRLLADYSFARDSIARFTFELKDATRDEALGVVERTYSDLVAEGGPWPFRLYANLLRGASNLAGDPDPAMRARAATCQKMLAPLLPLAMLSRVFFSGPGFRSRWVAAMRDTLRRFPLLFLAGCAGALVVLPLLAALYAAAAARNRLLPHGDQPPVIRREYGHAAENHVHAVVPPSTLHTDRIAAA